MLLDTNSYYSGELFRKVREAGEFYDEWYWISQLYDENWSPDKMD